MISLPTLNANACPGLLVLGPSCTECTDGRILSASFECTECLDSGLLVGLMVVGAGVGLFLLALYVQDLRHSQKSPYTILIKICVSYFQLNAAGLSFQFDWENDIADLLAVQEGATSFGAAYFEVACLTGTESVVQETLFFALAPGVLLGLVWAVLPCTGHTDVAKTVTMVVCFLLQPTLTQRTMSLFSCVRLGDGPDQLYMTQDLTVRCWSSEHVPVV